MGADLITYVSVGPETIEADNSEMQEVIGTVQTVQKHARRHADQLIVDGETDLEEYPLPTQGADLSASIPLDFHGDGQRLREIEHQEEIEAAENSTRLRSKALAFSGLGEFSEVLGKDREEIEVAIKEFIETWNGEILWRNATQRPMPDESDRKVVVAGERSMGDEPGGAYQVLKKAFAMGIAQHFGCQ